MVTTDDSFIICALKKRLFLFLIFISVCSFSILYSDSVYAEGDNSKKTIYTDSNGKTVEISFEDTITKDDSESSGFLYDKDLFICRYNLGYSPTLYVNIKNNTDSDFSFDINSIDTSVGKITDVYYMKKVESFYTYYEKDYEKTVPAGESLDYHIVVSPVKAGCFGIKIGNDTYNYVFKFLQFPESNYYVLKDFKQTDYHTFRATIHGSVSAYDGYFVYQKKGDTKKYSKVDDIKNTYNKYVYINVPKWNDNCRYGLIGYINVDNVKYLNKSYNNIYWSDLFTCSDLGTKISVKTSSKNSLLISWSKAKDAVKYELYVAEGDEYSSYKKIFKTVNNNDTEYTHKVKQGISYYFYIKITFKNGDVSVKRCKNSGYIPKKNLKSKSKTAKSITETQNNPFIYGRTYSYTRDGVDYVLLLNNRDVYIYKRTKADKLKKIKKFKLENFDYFGTFYAAPDGNYYFVYGYSNPNEKNNKVVIKVAKYNSKWKKGRTAKIRGKSSNVFKGIVKPFDWGGCSLALKGNTLYLHTARLMYRLKSDGLRHQSDISFQINTKTMKASNKSDAYCSHSFDQIALFKDDDLYLLDHGDGFPDGIMITMVKNYRKKDETNDSQVIFKLKGGSGAGVHSIEAGSNHLLVCGRALPLNNAINSVKGNDSKWARNLFLITVDRKTNKKKFIWLTKMNPKKSKISVESATMLKITDDRFAIIYSTARKDDNSSFSSKKYTTYYMVVDDTGKVIKKKKLKGITYSGYSYPILSNGYISWIERRDKIGLAYGYFPILLKTNIKINKIPVVY